MPSARSCWMQDTEQGAQQVRNRFLSAVQHQSGGMAGKLRSLFRRDKKEKKA